jgi:6-phosphogluconolactonase
MSAAVRRIEVFRQGDQLVEAACNIIGRAGQRALELHGTFRLVLSGGSTPWPMFDALASNTYRSMVPWTESHFFWADERMVPPDHPESNFGQATSRLLDHVPVRAEHLHRIQGELPPREAAAAYSRLLNSLPSLDQLGTRFDLVILGLGQDGHTASLFPGSPDDAADTPPAVPVRADYSGRPADRVTLTGQTLSQAAEILFVVTGAEKAAAVAATLEGLLDRVRWPAQRIAPITGRTTWLLDPGSSSLLASA